KAALEDLPAVPHMPAALDASPLQDARRDADQARRASAAAASTLAGLRTRRAFLEQHLNRVEPLAAALGEITSIETDTAEATRAPQSANAASTELVPPSAEL